MFFLFWAGVEVVVRQESVRLALPPGSLGIDTKGGEIDSKMALLDSYNRQGVVNCVILGDSMVDYGINPKVLQSEILKDTGQDYRCFNFGLRWNTNQTSATLAEVLSRRYKLSLILVGTDPMAFFSTNPMLRDIDMLPWIRYQLGDYSMEGFLVEHLMFYRYLLILPKNHLSIFNSPMKQYEERFQDGFESYDSIMAIPKKSREPYEEYVMDQKDLEGLQKIASLTQGKTRVIAFHIPFHPNDYPLFVVGGEKKYEEAFLNPVKEVINQAGLDYIESYPDIPSRIPKNGWLDHIHMNRDGANFFSQWLGGQVGEMLSR